ncbi:hypothetical protein [uncultured Ruegeria sp.]|uniref:hypothetical protein n=1 Tax=uncultured Ruegeria sp. TaxID=259304 RepID=UPI0026240EEE|nr:hypothetical protein [uncultured Ruegeria sp.]
MFSTFKKFALDESGAVTVDWVVLTAAIVAIGGMMYTLLNEGVRSVDEQTGQALSSMEVQQISFD